MSPGKQYPSFRRNLSHLSPALNRLALFDPKNESRPRTHRSSSRTYLHFKHEGATSLQSVVMLNYPLHRATSQSSPDHWINNIICKIRLVQIEVVIPWAELELLLPQCRQIGSHDGSIHAIDTPRCHHNVNCRNSNVSIYLYVHTDRCEYNSQ